MKVVVQRVTEASCIINYEEISSISSGYVLFVGFTHTDIASDVVYLAKKIANLRIFEDEHGKLNKSILDMNYDILSISQFTLYGTAKKGNRPSFTAAMEPVQAKKLFHQLTTELQTMHNLTVLEGVFGEHMEISLKNDGPVTIILESK